MRSIEEVEIQAAKNREELPRDPFSDGPRFHQSSHERDRGDDTDRQRDREYLKTIDYTEKSERPIHPTIIHRGQQSSQQMSASPVASGNPCLRNYFHFFPTSRNYLFIELFTIFSECGLCSHTLSDGYRALPGASWGPVCTKKAMRNL